MFLTPSRFQDFLSKNNYSDEIYDALQDDDLSTVVLTALEVLKKTHQPYITKNEKNKKLSTTSRKEGNIAFERGKLQVAMFCYNNALLLAPKDSKELILAISNRSAVFQKMTAYKACVKDIDICFSMSCPPEIVNKLNKRKKEVVSLAVDEESCDTLLTALSKKHTKCIFDNQEISCASSDIKVEGSDMPKIVASKDIKIGSVLVNETAYVSFTNKTNNLFCCHYCQKQTLNLIPCENCIYALFCNNECKNKCIEEYHKYECSILHVINQICYGPMPNLMIKAMLKLRQNCKTWRQFIEASYIMGVERIQSSSIQEIFDVKSLYSILSQKDDRPFVYGIKYDASFVCASLLQYLDENPSFFPKDIDLKKQAMQAVARIMMFLSLHNLVYRIYIPLSCQNDMIKYHDEPNYGCFPLLSKLSHCCTPNTIAVYNGNVISLIALQSIKSGDEITIAFQDHWLACDESRHNKNVTHFLLHGKVCSCNICMGKSLPSQVLSKNQKKMFDRLSLMHVENNFDFKIKNFSHIYEKILEKLDLLKDLPHSSEYKEVFKQFYKFKFMLERNLNSIN